MRSATFDLVIPLHASHTKFLGGLLGSITAWSRTPSRVILVASGFSTHARQRELQRVLDQPIPSLTIEVYRYRRSLSAGVARNIGISRAREPFTLMIDADDEFSPLLAEVAVGIAEENASDLVLWSYVLDAEPWPELGNANLRVIATDSLRAVNARRGSGLVSPSGPPLIAATGTEHRIHHGSLLVRREVFNVLKYSRRPVGEDVVFCRSALRAGLAVNFVDAPLMRWRKVHSTASRRNRHLKGRVFTLLNGMRTLRTQVGKRRDLRDP